MFDLTHSQTHAIVSDLPLGLTRRPEGDPYWGPPFTDTRGVARAGVLLDVEDLRRPTYARDLAAEAVTRLRGRQALALGDMPSRALWVPFVSALGAPVYACGLGDDRPEAPLGFTNGAYPLAVPYMSRRASIKAGFYRWLSEVEALGDDPRLARLGPNVPRAERYQLVHLYGLDWTDHLVASMLAHRRVVHETQRTWETLRLARPELGPKALTALFSRHKAQEARPVPPPMPYPAVALTLTPAVHVVHPGLCAELMAEVDDARWEIALDANTLGGGPEGLAQVMVTGWFVVEREGSLDIYERKHGLRFQGGALEVTSWVTPLCEQPSGGGAPLWYPEGVIGPDFVYDVLDAIQAQVACRVDVGSKRQTRADVEGWAEGREAQVDADAVPEPYYVSPIGASVVVGDGERDGVSPLRRPLTQRHAVRAHDRLYTRYGSHEEDGERLMRLRARGYAVSMEPDAELEARLQLRARGRRGQRPGEWMAYRLVRVRAHGRGPEGGRGVTVLRTVRPPEALEEDEG